MLEMLEMLEMREVRGALTHGEVRHAGIGGNPQEYAAPACGIIGALPGLFRT